jgi:organic radical activating enzyme
MEEDIKKIGFYTLSDERARNASATSQMKRCEMVITEYCNFSCPYCRGLMPEIFGDRKLKQLSLDEIKRNINLWCDGMPLENIRFTGGEPTLHKDIRDVVSYAKSKGITRIAISTNGSNKTELYHELIDLGVNDFSISLDACCSDMGDKMAGNVPGSFDKVVHNIREISKRAYTTVGVVLTPENINQTIDTITFADTLGVGDIRIISAAQFDQAIPALGKVPEHLLKKYPILAYRVHQFKTGFHVRGLLPEDPHKCAIVLDDSAIAGQFHFPCIIFMREGGEPIGKVGPNMRQERLRWHETHDVHQDPICKANCLDVCREYSIKYRKFHPDSE